MTTGTLLPVARELRFNFEEPPDPQTEEADRYHALELLAVWEERLEALEAARFWSHHSTKPEKNVGQRGKVNLRRAVHKASVVNHLAKA